MIGVYILSFSNHHLKQHKSDSFRSRSLFGDWFINYMVENTSQPGTFSTAGEEEMNKAGA